MKKEDKIAEQPRNGALTTPGRNVDALSLKIANLEDLEKARWYVSREIERQHSLHRLVGHHGRI